MGSRVDGYEQRNKKVIQGVRRVTLTKNFGVPFLEAKVSLWMQPSTGIGGYSEAGDLPSFSAVMSKGLCGFSINKRSYND